MRRKGSLTERTKRSQNPPHHGAAGAMNFQLILSTLQAALNSALLIVFNRFAVPTKLVPLSDIISLGRPYRKMNRFSD